MKEMELQQNGFIQSENENRDLIIHMENMLLSVELPLVSRCCIYKVPQKIRKLNQEAYTPTIVSIGPFHYGDKRLESMEDLKLRYLKSFFLERTHKGLGDCIGYIKKSEEIIRSCYSEAIEQTSDDFVKIILTDACFIIEYFLRSLEWPQEDPLLSKPWLRCDVKLDLILLENQLPWFVLEDLFNLTEPSCIDGEVSSFFDVAFHYFKVHFLQSILPNETNNKNFTINYFHEHYQQYIMKPDQVSMQLHNLTDLLRVFYLPLDMLPKREKQTVKHLFSASQLVEAGVKLHVGQDYQSVLELKFAKGALTIPRFEVCHWTETLLRNVVAFEQCHYPFQTYVTDYTILLDFLIDTSQDVDKLVEKGIMINTLGDSNAVAKMINNLCLNIVQENINGSYISLCRKLNCFYEDPSHKYKAIFIHDYFSTPWKITSFAAAIVLLLLTLIQATCSIISLF